MAVYGAGGYTGWPVAAEVVDAQADLVPAGRGAERLRTTAQGLRLTSPDIRTAGVDDPSALAKAFDGCAGVTTAPGRSLSTVSRSAAPRSPAGAADLIAHLADVRVEPLWSVEEN